MNQARLFAKQSSPAASVNTYVLEKYLWKIKFKKDNVSIVDAGSGDANTTLNVLLPRIPRKCKEVIGLDVSEHMTELATSVCNRPEVKFRTMDLATRNLPKEYRQRFDHGFTFFCMHWTSDIRLAYKNMFDMLVPEGDMLGNYCPRAPMFRTYVRMSKHPRWKSYFTKDVIARFEDMDVAEEKAMATMRGTGFVNYFCETDVKKLHWRDTDDFQVFLKSIDPVITRIKEGEREEYMKDFMEVIVGDKGFSFESTANDKGPVFINHEMLYIYASKV